MTEAVRHTRTGNPLRKCILLQLAAYGNDKTGECWPSLSTLAEDCDMSRRSVVTHIEALVEAGLVIKVERKTPTGHTSNLYRLASYEGGAGAALEAVGVVQELHRVVQEMHPPSAGAAPKSVSESVSESVNTHKGVRAPAGGLTKDQITQAIEHLNNVTGKEFKVTDRGSRNLVGKLGMDGYTLEEIKLVVEHKQADWGCRSEMVSNMKPSTLFKADRFGEYLANARAWQRPTSQPTRAPMVWGDQ